MFKKQLRFSALFLATVLITTSLDMTAFAAESLGTASTGGEYDAAGAVAVSFSETGASLTGTAAGIAVSGSTVTISAAGTYLFSGSCSNGNILVAKDAGAVQLVLDGLDLTSTTTAPIQTKGGTNVVTITAAEGTQNTLADTDRSAAKPKAAINADKQLILNGRGELTVTGNNKNGIKTDTDLTISDLTLNVTAADNGLAADDVLTVNSGTLTINAQGDALHSSPDSVVAGETSADIVINGGSFDLTAQGDGIAADHDLAIYGGSFGVTTNGGYTTTLATDADSCKGFKGTNSIVILGGTFVVNSADDAFHSDAYVYLTAGDFTIQTGDDAVHADTSLIVGTDDTDADALKISITDSYEGLEAGTVYIYSGDISVVSSDDGINAAGDSSTDDDTFQPGGGGMPGGPGGNSAPGGTDSQIPDAGTTDSPYSINIYGGTILVNVSGDGLDSNGDIEVDGGVVTVWGAASDSQTADNSALDYDGTFTLNGGTILGAGSKQMAETITSAYQTVLTSTATASQGQYIVVTNSDSKVVACIKVIKAINHITYSSALLKSGATISISSTEQSVPTYNTANVPVPSVTAGSYTGTQKVSLTCATSGASIYYTTDGSAPSRASTKYTSAISVPVGSTTIKAIAVADGYYDSALLKASYVVAAAAEPETETESETETETTETETTETENQQIGTVSGFTAKAKTYDSISLSWKQVAGAEAYYIYRSVNKNAVNTLLAKIPSGTVTSYTDSTAATGTVYYYKICACAGGVYGALSDTVSAKTSLNKTQISKITKVKINSIKLTWKQVTGATGYEVYRSAKKSSGYKKIKTVKGSSTITCTNTGLSVGKTYYYKVRAYIVVNGVKVYSSYSSVASEKTSLSKSAITKISRVKSTSAKITWNKVTAATGYEVYRSAKKTGAYKKVKTVSGAGNITYTDTKLTKGKTFYYKVRAYTIVNGKKVYGSFSTIKSVN